ncbi:hypothetical protein PAHAL_2G123500 [Panicum hallii]|uniref:Bifunctional inhibitor/plant lipid transfer protein/seed storage helical domain-containing protein n=1 Tax=Panicum hallii TaxID=206008 RepID=A0A2T8KNV8_9POAL|nr:hypothetical protein PAHAL_2G123500 [Panicum hallii]
MALSSKCKLRIFLLIGFAVVLQPSSAIRAEGAPAADRRAAPPSGIPPLPPQPRECRPWLMRMMPCAGFITNSSFAYGTVTCLCHVVNGDVGRLLPAPMIHARMVELFSVCGHDVRVEMLAAACNLTDDVPPIDLPSPPPSTPLPPPALSSSVMMAMTN